MSKQEEPKMEPQKEESTTEHKEKEKEKANVEKTTEKGALRPLKEGKAEILVSTDSREVFYNPAQETNRDLSILMISTWQQICKQERETGDKKTKKKMDVSEGGIKILEGLSASGLRSVRYWKEIPNIDHIVANDFDATAVHNITRNVTHNQIPLDRIIPSHNDACMVMYQHKDKGKRFDVVDLDPYGSASVFLDSAVQAVSDGGLLCVTCTDMAVLCGNHPEASFNKYGSVALKTPYCHEMALRIVLSCISAHANRYKRYIVPLVSLSIDFYVRLFVRVFTSAEEARNSLSNTSQVYQCIGCDTFHLQPIGKYQEFGNSKKFVAATGPPTSPLCEFCGKKFHIGGPIWTAPIFQPAALSQVISMLKANMDNFKTSKRLLGMLTALSEELPDQPLFYTLPSLCNTMHLNTPPFVQVRSALLHLGKQVSRSHTDPQAIKTTATNADIWDIMRALSAKSTNPPSLKPNSPAALILSKPPAQEINFEVHPLAFQAEESIPKFLPNPEDNWGPMARAKRKRDEKDGDDKETKTNKQ